MGRRHNPRPKSTAKTGCATTSRTCRVPNRRSLKGDGDGSREDADFYYVDQRPDFFFRRELMAVKPVARRKSVAGSGVGAGLTAVIDPARPVLSNK